MNEFVSVQHVHSIADVWAMLLRGEGNKSRASTRMNAASSRSHRLVLRHIIYTYTCVYIYLHNRDLGGTNFMYVMMHLFYAVYSQSTSHSGIRLMALFASAGSSLWIWREAKRCKRRVPLVRLSSRYEHMYIYYYFISNSPPSRF